jgi:hypothetical protein
MDLRGRCSRTRVEEQREESVLGAHENLRYIPEGSEYLQVRVPRESSRIDLDTERST